MSEFNYEMKRTWWQSGYVSQGLCTWLFKVEQVLKANITTLAPARCCVRSESMVVYDDLNLSRYVNPAFYITSITPNNPLDYTLTIDNNINITDVFIPAQNSHDVSISGFNTLEELTEDRFGHIRGTSVENFTTVRTNHDVGGYYYSGLHLLSLPIPSDISSNYEYLNTQGNRVDFLVSGIADLVNNDFEEYLKTDTPVLHYLTNGDERYLSTGQYNDDDVIDTKTINKKKRSDDDDDWDDDTSKSDNNDSDDTPTTTALSCRGAMNVYVMSTLQLRGIFKWFWNDMIEDARTDNMLEYLTGVFGDMGQCLSSVRLYPISVPTDGSSNLILGRYDSAIPLSTISTDTNKVFECEYTIPRLKGNFLDFAPYNQLYLYLPYVGLKELDTNMYMGHTLKVKYFVDFTNGGLDVLVFRDGTNTEHFNGIIGADIPYSFDGGKGLKDIVIDSVVQTGVSSIGTVVGGAIGGAAGQVVGDGLTSVIGNATSGGTQNISMVHHTTTASNNNIFNMPRSVQLWQIRPESYKDSKYGATHGYVYKKSKKLSNVEGFTICENVKLKFGHTKNSDNVVINPSDDEQMRLKQLLESGVYL